MMEVPPMPPVRRNSPAALLNHLPHSVSISPGTVSLDVHNSIVAERNELRDQLANLWKVVQKQHIVIQQLRGEDSTPPPSGAAAADDFIILPGFDIASPASTPITPLNAVQSLPELGQVSRTDDDAIDSANRMIDSIMKALDIVPPDSLSPVPSKVDVTAATDDEQPGRFVKSRTGSTAGSNVAVSPINPSPTSVVSNQSAMPTAIHSRSSSKVLDGLPQIEEPPSDDAEQQALKQSAVVAPPRTAASSMLLQHQQQPKQQQQVQQQSHPQPQPIQNQQPQQQQEQQQQHHHHHHPPQQQQQHVQQHQQYQQQNQQQQQQHQQQLLQQQQHQQQMLQQQQQQHQQQQQVLHSASSSQSLSASPNHPISSPALQTKRPSLATSQDTSIQVVSSSLTRPNHPDPVLFLINVKPPHNNAWRIEKGYTDISALDARIRKDLKKPDLARLVRLERGLFQGINPSKSDARRTALEAYLQRLIDVVPDSRELMEFLTSNLFVGEAADAATVDDAEAKKKAAIREGFLAKKGKNFGGWKTRFYRLRTSTVEWYDERGKEFMGSIKLRSCLISRIGGDHAFTLTEYKPESFNPPLGGADSHPHESRVASRHTLSAGSDAERDEWVKSLWAQIVKARPGARPDVSVLPLLAEAPPVSGGGGGGNGSGGGGQQQPKTVAPSPSPGTPNAQQAALQYLALHNPPSNRAGYSHLSPNPSSPAAPPSLGYTSPGSGLAGSGVSGIGSGPPIPQPSPPRSAVTDEMTRIMAQNPPYVCDDSARRAKRIAMTSPNVTTSLSFGGSSGRADGATSRGGQLINSFVNWSKRPSGGNVLAPQQNNHHQQAGGANGPSGGGGEKVIFGVPLEVAVATSQLLDNLPIPSVVFRCIEYLDAVKAWEEEGLYRLSGSSSEIQVLKERFNTDGDVDLLASMEERHDVHAVAGLLKLYLRDLQSCTGPVLTKPLMPDFVQIASNPHDRADRITELSQLLHRLPAVNYALVKVVVGHLIRVVQWSHVNRMSVRNVGIVFSPTLGIPVAVLALMMSEFDVVFCWDDAERSKIMRERERELTSRMQRDHRDHLVQHRDQVGGGGGGSAVLHNVGASTTSWEGVAGEDRGAVGGDDGEEVDEETARRKKRRDKARMSVITPSGGGSGVGVSGGGVKKASRSNRNSVAYAKGSSDAIEFHGGFGSNSGDGTAVASAPEGDGRVSAPEEESSSIDESEMLDMYGPQSARSRTNDSINIFHDYAGTNPATPTYEIEADDGDEYEPEEIVIDDDDDDEDAGYRKSPVVRLNGGGLPSPIRGPSSLQRQILASSHRDSSQQEQQRPDPVVRMVEKEREDDDDWG